LAYLIVYILSLRHFHALPLLDDNMQKARRKADIATRQPRFKKSSRGTKITHPAKFIRVATAKNRRSRGDEDARDGHMTPKI
jgi:hypothetical protein